MRLTGSAWGAGGIKACVPKKQASAFPTPKHGKCAKGYELTTLGEEGKHGADGKAGPAGGAGKEGPQGPQGTSGLTGEQVAKLEAILPTSSSTPQASRASPRSSFQA